MVSEQMNHELVGRQSNVQNLCEDPYPLSSLSFLTLPLRLHFSFATLFFTTYPLLSNLHTHKKPLYSSSVAILFDIHPPFLLCAHS